ncbi:MAG: ATP-binding cassette domain-containing protein [Planctomycetota bacterium]|nr:ATP-binding cassette domain-containing protein [Planctomycetota bacterium]
MSLVIGENIMHRYTDREVLRGVSFHLGQHERVVLVGPNGVGKTTLLKIIGGMIDPTAGSVHRARGLRVVYLPQDTPALEGTTIHSAALGAFADLRRKEQELHALTDQLAAGGNRPDLLNRYGAMQAEFEACGGYEYPKRIEQVLMGLGFPRDMWDRPLANLSGGQRTRAYLATLLLAAPDVLMLDEPTNHLDLDSVEWLEGWIAGFRGAVVLVSHDRYLLDRATTSTWDLSFTALESYPAPYTQYLVLREERTKERLRQYEAQQEMVARTEEYIRRNIYANRTGVARGRRSRLEKLKDEGLLDRPREAEGIHLNLKAGGRTGDIVLRAAGLAVGYDPVQPLLSVEQLEVMRGDRVAILGPNGVGKTTLLLTLLGRMQPLAGDVRRGANLSVGYLSQARTEVNPQTSALEAVREAGVGWTPERARALLGSLLLSGDEALKPFGQLSGGQQSRVCLARLVVQGVNVLALDEPTNHLDIPSCEVIQDVLQEFEGAVLFISHDRYLVKAVATHIWAIDGREVRCILGGWDDYMTWRQERLGCAGHEVDEAKEARKASYEERKALEREARRRENAINRLRKRHEEIEAKIQAAEENLARQMRKITAAGEAGDLDRVASLGREYQQADAALKALWAEWEDIGGQLEQLG